MPYEKEDYEIVIEPKKAVVPLKELIVKNIDQSELTNKSIKLLAIPPIFPSQLSVSKKKQ